MHAFEKKNNGSSAEDLFERALCHMRNRRPSVLAERDLVVLKYVKARPNSFLDRFRVDFSVQILRGDEQMRILVQVTSSARKYRKKVIRMKSLRHLFVHILVRVEHTVQSVVDQFANELTGLLELVNQMKISLTEREKQIKAYLSRLDPREKKTRRRDRRDTAREIAEFGDYQSHWCPRPQFQPGLRC